MSNEMNERKAFNLLRRILANEKDFPGDITRRISYVSFLNFEL
jgi:hypothetical protein